LSSAWSGSTTPWSIRKVVDKWVASFHHDPMSGPDGSGSGATPWRAVQDAAWMAVKRAA
jgi:hypothetical protein